MCCAISLTEKSDPQRRSRLPAEAEALLALPRDDFPDLSRPGSLGRLFFCHASLSLQ
jgi:hypothetical protein